MTPGQSELDFIGQVCHIVGMSVHTAYVVVSGTMDLRTSGCYYNNRTEHVRSAMLLSIENSGIRIVT